MKLNILFLTLFLIACTQQSENSSVQEITPVRVLSLPLVFAGDTIKKNNYFASPQNNRDSIFRNKTLFPKDIQIARLPQRNDIQVVLTCNKTEDTKNMFIQGYTLDGNNQIIDHLTLYSIEKIPDNSFSIRQTFEITNNYRFKVSKQLNTLLIEQLFYKIDEKGFFEEVRDGLTPTIAYESWDNIHYTIEWFIWDYNESGGLYKKEIQISYYKLNPDGSIEKIKNQ